MKKEIVTLESIALVGLATRTNNTAELKPTTSKIGPLTKTYWGDCVAEAFRDRVSPKITYSVYTDYESDEHGEYTYFVGEQVRSLKKPEQSPFTSALIPAGTYQKFTTSPGKMPDVVITAWQEIWKMTPEILGGKRSYRADFEVYDDRASDLSHAVVDIYIGIEK